MLQLTILDFIVLCLAAYRLTHLIVYDKLFEPMRNYFVTRDFSGPVPTFTLQGGKVRRFIGKVLVCHWCSGMWVAGALVFGWVQYSWAIWVYVALAAAAVLSLIETAWLKSVGYPELLEKRKGQNHTT